VSDQDSQSLAPPVAQALAALGWPVDHPAIREAAPVAARRNNLVFVAPPSPAWARPVLGGVISRLLADRRGPVVGLGSPASLDEWVRVAGTLAAGSGLRLAAAHTLGRVTRLLRADAVDLLFITPETAHELVRRSALKMDTIDGLLLLHPEGWEQDELLSALLQDAAREAQRILITSDLARAASLIERHVWRAPLVDLLAGEAATAPPVRTITVGWRGRLEALSDLIEQLDPDTLSVWAVDLADRDAIERIALLAGTAATVSTGIPAPGSPIIAYDLPTPARLAELGTAGEVVLLVPPGGESYVAGLSPRRRPLLLRGGPDKVRAGFEADRLRAAELIERGGSPAAYLAIAPLLERHDASAVAAAFYELWDAARTARADQPPPVLAAAPSAKLWIGIGKRDAVSPNDIVGALVNDAGVGRESVGKVEIRESFTLVELRGGDPEAVAERLTGKTIRKRRLVARLDRGRTRDSDGGARPRRPG
jgi:hypothetical protein